MVSVGVVIPARNIAVDAVPRRCLGSLLGQSVRPEIVVVVYGGSKDIVSLCESYGVGYIDLDVVGPWSKGVACNVGIRSLDTDFVVQTDIDIIFADNFVEAVIDAYAANPDILALCHAWMLPSGVLSEFCRSTIGCSRRWWHALRGFDERFQWSSSVDNDLVDRARCAGLDLVLLNDATDIFHQGHGYRYGCGGPCLFDASAAPNGEDWGGVNRVVDQGRRGKTALKVVARRVVV